MKNKIRASLVATATALMALPVMVAAAGFEIPADTNLPAASLVEIITGIMNWLLMAIGILGVIGFAIAGILYLTSAGDETRAGQAKSAMLYSILGVIVALVGIVALKAARAMLDSSTGTF